MIDNTDIIIQAGNGGNGKVSFRREKFVPKGGPDGGDGGNGGSVFFVSSTELNNLSDLNRQKRFQAENGENGKNKKMHGKNGNDLIIKIPVGTLVYEQYANKQKLLFDFTKPNEIQLITKGGKGGLGNVHFSTSTNRAPKTATNGEHGENKKIILELKLLADVGIVGLPNSGKSTLLSIVSNARPVIADYPFTTLEPNLGKVTHKNRTFVIADIPGLIENAHIGKGLGVQFLKHIQRTRIIIHLIDINSPDLFSNYNTIYNELEQFDKKLTKKKTIVALNKVDSMPNYPNNQDILKFIKKHKPIIISTLTKENISQLLDTIIELL